MSRSSEITLSWLKNILQLELRFRKQAGNGPATADAVRNAEQRFHSELATTPGMPALKKLLKWASDTPTVAECAELSALLTSDDARHIRNFIFPQLVKLGPEEMTLPDIAAVVNRVQAHRRRTSPEGLEKVKRQIAILNRFDQHPEQFFSGEELQGRYFDFVDESIRKLPQTDDVPPVTDASQSTALPPPAPGAAATTGTRPKTPTHKKIPPAKRTKPMSFREAARRMGKGSSRDAAEWLSAAVRDGSVACEHISRQLHVFSLDDFPQSVHQQILPE
jgi:hypothetical protein